MSYIGSHKYVEHADNGTVNNQKVHSQLTEPRPRLSSIYLVKLVEIRRFGLKRTCYASALGSSETSEETSLRVKRYCPGWKTLRTTTAMTIILRTVVSTLL